MPSPIKIKDVKTDTTVRGPLRTLDENAYKSKESLKYPLDIDQYKHRIQFNINIPERSRFDAKIAAGVNSVTNQLNGVGVGELKEYISDSAAAGATALITAFETAKSIPDAFSAGVKAFTTGGKQAAAVAAGAKIAGGAAGGLVKGGLAELILSSVEVQRKTKRLAQTIHLYIPDTLNTTMVNQFDSVSLTEAAGMAGFAATGASALGQSAEDLVKNLPGGPGANRAGITDAGAYAEAKAKLGAATGQFGGGIDQVLLQSAGLAINPAIEVLFKAIAPREFLFDFKFIPKNQQEAKEVLSIIKAFRYHAAPEYALKAEGGLDSKGRYLIPPSEFDIDFIYETGHNPALPKISTCVLEGIDVNYSGGGQFATFEDGVPVEIGMQLRFKEVETLHKALIDQGY